MLGVIFQFVAVFVITNNADTTIFGKFSFLTSALVLLGAICLLGMNNSFLQFSGRLQAVNNYNEVVRLYKRMVTILSSSFIVIVFIYLILSYVIDLAYFKNSDVNSIVQKVIIALFPFSLSLLNFQVLRGLHKLYLSEIASNILRFGSLLLLCLILLWSDSFDYLLDGYILIFFIISAVTSIIIVNEFKTLRGPQDKKISYSEILKTSFPMSFSIISLLIMQSVDIFILEEYWGFETVGYYGAAVKVTTGIGIILATINAIIAPDISKLFFSGNQKDLKALIIRSTNLNFYLTVPLIILIYLFSEEILSLFGSSYIMANSALIIMIVAQMFNAFCGSVGVYLNMTGRQNTFLMILLFSLLVNIALNVILIPKYGMQGAAIATGISLVLWNIIGVVYIYIKDKIGVFVLSKWIT